MYGADIELQLAQCYSEHNECYRKAKALTVGVEESFRKVKQYACNSTENEGEYDLNYG